jgi:hypothetical protein
VTAEPKKAGAVVCVSCSGDPAPPTDWTKSSLRRHPRPLSHANETCWPSGENEDHTAAPGKAVSGIAVGVGSGWRIVLPTNQLIAGLLSLPLDAEMHLTLSALHVLHAQGAQFFAADAVIEQVARMARSRARLQHFRGGSAKQLA